MPYIIAPHLLQLLIRGGVVAYVVLIVVLVVNVLGEKRNPRSTLAWVMALILFPVGGALIYFFLGRSLRNVKMISRRNRRKLINSKPRAPLPKLDLEFSAENRQLVRLAGSVADAELYTGNAVEIFNNGTALFERFFADLREAREYINLQFYIIACDALGRRLHDILCQKAREGVKVRVIYDYVGSFGSKSREFFRSMRRAGVDAHAFFRIEFPNKLSLINWRNHRKVAVIDGRLGYIGGFNIADRYLGGGKFDIWRDLMVRVEGPAVAGLQSNFAIDWKFMGHPLLTDHISTAPVECSGDAIPDVRAQLVASGPTSRWAGSLFMYFKAISGAKRRAWIQTPYFLPSDDLLKALQSAALSGVDVRVMVPLTSDSAVLAYASDSFVEECLLAGIKVFKCKPGMLHAKLLIIDDDYVSLGSTNFDYRSFDHNFEENIVMYSHTVNSRLAELYKADERNCTRLRLSTWNKRRRRKKALEALSRLLSPVL